MKAKPKLCSFCGKIAPLWKSNPKTCHACARKQATTEAIERSKGEHNHKGLTASEDGKPAKVFKYRTAEIKKVSTKQQKLNAAYKVLRDAFMKKRKYCEARLEGCTGKATECHHKAGRGEYLLDDTKYLALCHNCHVFITEHSQFAMERGFSESRLSKAI
jgi:hypothetical protein